MEKIVTSLSDFMDLSKSIFAFSKSIGTEWSEFDGYAEYECVEGVHHLTIDIVHVPGEHCKLMRTEVVIEAEKVPF